MTTDFHNPWRTSLENCISGDNYLRASEYLDLIEELDELYRRRAVDDMLLLLRAEDLHVKGCMPWHQAEETALGEAGIDDARIDELIGECAGLGMDSIITGEDELRRFARAVLVHGEALNYVGRAGALLLKAERQESELRELRNEAMRVLIAWDGTVLPKRHDGMMQERMECLRAILGPNG